MTNTPLTFAELTVIAQDSPHWNELRQLLSIPDVDQAVVAAGISSLLARGLAVARSDGFRVRDDIRAAVDLLWTPAHVITLTRGDESGLNVAQLLVPDDGGRTVVVSLVQPGVFDISPLVPAQDRVVQLRELVMALAEEGRTGLAIGTKDSVGEILLGHDAGVWSLGRTSQPLEEHPKTPDRDAIGTALDRWFSAWLLV